MLPVFLLPLASVIGVTLLSFIGIFFFLIDDRVIKRHLLYFVSLSTGALLGDVFIHIIPEMAEDGENFGNQMLVVLLGILFSFAVEKVIHWRHCHVLPEADHHDHHHPVGVISMIGETLHNFIDGVVIAASFLVSVPLGVSTTIAIIFHEIPHEIGNFAVLLHSGFGRKRALLMNGLSGCAGILGALLVLGLTGVAQSSVIFLLPFAAGNLLYIAGSDLIPELHKHTRIHQGVIQLVAMIIGMAFMYGMLLLE